MSPGLGLEVSKAHAFPKLALSRLCLVLVDRSPFLLTQCQVGLFLFNGAKPLTISAACSTLTYLFTRSFVHVPFATKLHIFTFSALFHCECD